MMRPRNKPQLSVPVVRRRHKVLFLGWMLVVIRVVSLRFPFHDSKNSNEADSTAASPLSSSSSTTTAAADPSMMITTRMEPKQDPPPLPLIVPTPTLPLPPCVYAKWPSGWGNVLYTVFYGVIQIADSRSSSSSRSSTTGNSTSASTSTTGTGSSSSSSSNNYNYNNNNNNKYPCVLGYGGMVANLFSNLPSCPPDMHHSQCYDGLTPLSPYSKKKKTKKKKNNKTKTTTTTATTPTQISKAASSGKVSFTEIRLFLKDRIQDYPDLFQINATFANEIFQQAGATFTVQDFLRRQQPKNSKQQRPSSSSSSCAVHLRFGDIYSRKKEQMSEKNQIITAKSEGRACRRHETTTMDAKEQEQEQEQEQEKAAEGCFDRLAQKVRSLCPADDDSNNSPTFLAADVPQFVQYFCQQEKKRGSKRRFLSSCNTTTTTTAPIIVNHINDVGVTLVNVTDGGYYSIHPQGLPTFVNLLSDWLALALAQNLFKIGHSTFSETAAFPYYT